MERVRGLQERAARAMPAAEVRRVGGWWLRHSPGPSWWVGSVLPHGAVAPGALAGLVGRAEEFSRARGVAARFQITPGVAADGLDAALAERGYLRGASVSLQAAAIDDVLATGTPSWPVRWSGRPDRAWFAVWHAVNGDDGDSRDEWEMLHRVQNATAYASVMDGERVIAVGRAVAETGWAGVFGMAVLPEARGRGAGRAVLTALAAWAARHDATNLYLQVERGNADAVRLYRRAGLREVTGYHYRSAAGQP